MAIQPKKKPVIKKGTGYVYNEATFEKEHKVSNFFTVDTAEELLELVNPFEYRGRRFITFDTETHPFYRSSHEVPPSVVRRFVGKGKQAVPQDYPFELSICDGTNSYALYDTEANGFAKFKALAPLFEDESIEKIAHNIKFDMHQLANVGLTIKGRLHDTLVLCKLTDENRFSFTLKDIAAKNPRGIVKFEYMVENYKQMNKVQDYSMIPRQLLSEYANADVWNAYVTFVDEYEKLVADDLEALYDNECALTVALYSMERYGMRINGEYEVPLKEALQQLCDENEQSIYDEAGRMFNINSGRQLYDVLVGLGVNPQWIPTTDKGNPKLDKNVMASLSDVHDVQIVKKILEFKKSEKLLNTYAIGIYGQRDAEYRVHGSINQSEALTGRMSITSPALQTLPKKDTRIRSAFVPDEGYQLWFFDLDQIEYRLFAHYCKAQWLLDSIAAGYDVHSATAAMLYGYDTDTFVNLIHQEDKEAKDKRAKGKTINFALLYGVGISHLAELLKCSETEASEMKARYFSNFPEARVFVSTVQQVIKMRGFVKNFFGRRRRLDADDCYKAPNSLIQGCAADYIKFKLVNIYKYIQYNNLKSHVVNIVHDELVINIAEDELEHVPVFRWLLSDFEQFRCPITAGAEKGNPSWGEKTEPDGVGFKAPDDFSFLDYNVYDGSVFKIRKEV